MKQKTGIEKIQQHISECHERIEQKRKMWIQAQNTGDWMNSESLGKAMNDELRFVNGLERALAYLEDDLEFTERLKLNVSKRIQRGVKPVSRDWNIISLPNDGTRHLKADDGSTLCGVEINEFESWTLLGGDNCDRCNLVLEYLIANGYRHAQ